MSQHSVIDEKVVKMSLDNGEFNSAIDKSIKSIEKLENKLKFEDASDGFDQLTKDANKVDLSHIEKALDSINNKFKLMEAISTMALYRIADKAVDVGFKITKALTIQTPLDGLREYELKMGSIQTILANTRKQGTKLKDVTETLDELNHYADKTVYVFSDMTRAISQFTTAGVSLDQATTAIKGMSNLAAAVGADNATLSRVNYQVSQALNTGVFRLIDWRSLENTGGMGGQIMQDAIKETAREFGVNVDAMIAKHGSFRESLQEGWLTADIYLKTMEKFSDPKNYPQYAYMEEAATKVRSFKKLVETTMESIGSRWAGIFETIIGDFDEATALWSTLNQVINGPKSILTKIMDGLEGIIERWDSMGGRKSMLEGLVNVFATLWTWIRPVVYAFRDMQFLTSQGLIKASRNFSEITKGLQLTGEKARDVYKTFRAIFTVFELAGKIVKAGIYALSPVLDLVAYLLGKIFGVTGDLSEIILRLRDPLKELIDRAKEFVRTKIVWVVEAIKNFIDTIDFMAIKNAIAAIVPIIVIVIKLIIKILGYAAPLINFIAKLIPKAIQIAQIAIGGLLLAIGGVVIGLGKVIEFIVNKVKDLIKFLTGVGDGAVAIVKDLTKVGDKAKGISGWIADSVAIGMNSADSKNTVKNAAAGMCETIEESIRDELQVHSPSPLFMDIGSWIPKSIVEGMTSVDTSESVIGLASSMAGKIVAVNTVAAKESGEVWIRDYNPLVKKASDDETKNFVSNIEEHETVLDRLCNFINSVAIRIKDILVNLSEVTTRLFETLLNNLVDIIIAVAKSIIDKVAALVSGIWKILTELRTYLYEKYQIDWLRVFGAVTLFIVAGLIVAAVKMIFSIFNAVTGIANVASMMANGITGGGVLTGLVDNASKLFAAIAVVTAGIVALTVIDPTGDKMYKAAVIIGIMIVVLGVMFILVNMLTQKSLVIEKGQKAVSHVLPIFGSFAVIMMALVSLTKVIKGMSDREVDNLNDTILHIMSWIAGMTLLITVLSALTSSENRENVTNSGTKLESTLGGVAKLIGSIAMLFVGIAAAFWLMQDIDWDNLNKGMPLLIMSAVWIAALLGILAIIVKIVMGGNIDESSGFTRNAADKVADKITGKHETITENHSKSVSGPLLAVAKMIKAISKLMISIAVAFILLSWINWDKLNEGYGYLIATAAFIIIVLLEIGYIAQEVGKAQQNVPKDSKSIDIAGSIGKIIYGLAGLFIAIAVMFRTFSKIDWSFLQNISALGAILLVVGMVVGIFGLIAYLVMHGGNSTESSALIANETGISSLSQKTGNFGNNTDGVVAAFGKVISGLAKLILSFTILFAIMSIVNWDNANKGFGFLIAIIFLIGMILTAISFIIIKSQGDKNISFKVEGIMGAVAAIVVALGVLFVLMGSDWLVDANQIQKLSGAFIGVAIFLGVVMAAAIIISSTFEWREIGKLAVVLGLLTAFILALALTVSKILAACQDINKTKVDAIVQVMNSVLSIIAIVGIIAAGLAILAGALSSTGVGIAGVLIGLATFVVVMGMIALIMSQITSLFSAISEAVDAIRPAQESDPIGTNLKLYLENVAQGIKMFCLKLSIIDLIFLALAAPALVKFAKALAMFASLDGEKVASAMDAIADSLNNFVEQIISNLDAWQAFILVLWESVIPLTVLTLAIGLASFGIAHLIFVLGLLAIVLALVFGATDSESFSNMLSEAFSTDNVIKAAEGLGEILGKAAAAVIGGALIGLPKGMSNWLVDLANPEGKTIRKMEQEEWREYQNSMGRGEAGNRWGLERYDNDNKLYRRIDYNNTGYLTRVYKDTEEDLRELESLLDASDAYLESLNPSTAGGLSADEIRTSAKMAITMLTSQMADEYTLEAGQFDKKYFADSLGVEKYSEFISDNEKFHDAVNNRIDAIHSTLEGIEQAILKKFGYLSPKLTDTFAGKILNEIGFKYYESGYSTAEYYKNKNGDNEQGSVPSVNQGVVIGSPKIGVAVETDPRYRAPTKNGGYASIGNGKLQTLDVVDDINDHIISQVMATDYESIGNWIFISIASGMDKSKDALWETTKNMAKSVEDTIRNTLQIHSLSPLLEAIGEWIPESLLQGIQNIDLSGGIKGIAQSIWGLLKSLFGKLTDWIKETFPELWSWISRFFDLGGSFDANTAIATNYTMYDSLEKRLLYDQRLQNEINAAAEGLEGEEAEAAKAAKIAELREQLWNDYLDNSIYGEYDVDDIYKSLSEFFDTDLGGGLDGLGDISTGLAGGANSAFDSAMGTNGAAGNTTNNEITFNQYNYSPEPVDRMEIYQQTRRQLESYRMYMGSYV